MKERYLGRILLEALAILLIFAFWFVLVLKNFSPGFWLSGWDNLHPEFDFALNIRRALSAVWQEHQGVGLLAGMAHAADLPRQIILWVFSFILPSSLVRNLWSLAMLLLGPIGAFFLTKFLVGDKKILPATLTSLFYLLNLATVQYFYTPFETFVSFYGFLPWLLYFAAIYIKEDRRKHLFWLLALSFFGSTAFYVQTLFIVYILLLGILCLEIALKNRLKGIKRLILALFIVFTANAYWLLPTSYFAVNNSSKVSQAHQNKIATIDTRYYNENRATFENITKLKGFWFDYRDFDGSSFDEIMSEWRSHTESNRFNFVTSILFYVSLLGFVLAIFGKKINARIAGLTLFFICYFALATTDISFSAVLREAFRSVFTKWSVAFSLVLAIGIGYFVYFLGKIPKLGKSLAILGAIFLVGFMFITVKPAFEGNLIYKNLKVEYPQEYFNLFDFFKDKPKESRIAPLPLNSMWGWSFYNWGYRGTGFLWYGFNQPLLNRSFDVWSPYNESFYAEASRALYASDFGSLTKVLEKYQVKYLILDESVINAGGSTELLFTSQIKDFVSLANIKEVAKFGFLTVYETDLRDGFVSTPEAFGRLDTDSTYSETDTVYYSYGNYINDSEGTTFPFVNFDKRMGIKIENLGDRLLIKSGELQFSGAKNLVYPDLLFGEKKESPRVIINEEKKTQISLPIDQKTSANLFDSEQESRFQNCDLKKIGSVQRQAVDQKVRFLAQNGGVACEFFNFSDLSHQEGYLLRIKGKNIEGRSLKIYLQNWVSNRMDLEELLPNGDFDEYFFVLPKGEVGKDRSSGYSLNLETRSFGRIASENLIETIEFIPVPIEWLRQIRLEPENGKPDVVNNLVIREVKKTGTWLYKVETEGEGLLILGQGYEPGWIAFSRGDKNKFEHVRVNSWANGWFIPEGKSPIYLVFWPQLLEYLGFGILGLTTIAITRKMFLKLE